MKLYFAPGTCALAPHITLEWIGTDYQAEQVEMNSESYKKINPAGSVPALKDVDGSIKTQAGAILQYLSNSHLSVSLGADNNPQSQFLLDETMAFLTGDVHPAFWPFFGPQRYTVSGDKDDIANVKQASYALVDKVLTKLDNQIAENDGHVVLGRRTIADPYAFALSRWADYLPKKVNAYPHLAEFHAMMKQDAGVQAALKVHGIKT